jgi:hypothetical protein
MSYPAGGPAGQVCGICLFSRTGPAEDAVTTIGGVAVCDDHLSIAAGGGSFNSMIAAAGGPHSPPRRPAEE